MVHNLLDILKYHITYRYDFRRCHCNHSTGYSASKLEAIRSGKSEKYQLIAIVFRSVEFKHNRFENIGWKRTQFTDAADDDADDVTEDDVGGSNGACDWDRDCGGAETA